MFNKLDIVARIEKELSARKIPATRFASDMGGKGRSYGKSTVYSWRKNQSTSYMDDLQDIADYLGVSTDYLLTGKENLSQPILNLAESPKGDNYMENKRISREARECLRRMVPMFKKIAEIMEEFGAEGVSKGQAYLERSAVMKGFTDSGELAENLAQLLKSSPTKDDEPQWTIWADYYCDYENPPTLEHLQFALKVLNAGWHRLISSDKLWQIDNLPELERGAIAEAIRDYGDCLREGLESTVISSDNNLNVSAPISGGFANAMGSNSRAVVGTESISASELSDSELKIISAFRALNFKGQGEMMVSLHEISSKDENVEK